MTRSLAGRPLRRGLLVAVVGALCLLVAGCSAVTTLIDTSQALRDAGYQSVSVSFHLGSGDEVDVSVKVSATATNADAQNVARVVWNKFHERFQWLHVTVHGTGGSSVFRVYEYQDLVTMFGPRNPAWDRSTISSATTRLGAFIVVGLVVAGAAVAVVAVVVSRRKRDRRGGGYPPGGDGGRWQPGAGWQPGGGWPPNGGAPPAGPPQGGWQPGGGGQWAPDPLWPPPAGPPPGRAPTGGSGRAPTGGSGWGPAPPPADD